jgi:hypothetical protein
MPQILSDRAMNFGLQMLFRFWEADGFALSWSVRDDEVKNSSVESPNTHPSVTQSTSSLNPTCVRCMHPEMAKVMLLSVE